jgi:hypothetical protein
MSDSLSFQLSEYRHKTVVAGVILSLLLHAILLYQFGPHMAADVTSAEQQGVASLLIQLMPLKNGTKAAPATVEDDTRDKPYSREAHLARPAPPPQSEAQIEKQDARKLSAMASAPAAVLPHAGRPAAEALPGHDSEVGVQPQIDLDAARKSARKFATEYPRRSDAPVAQLQAKPLTKLETEASLGRNIANTARPDCHTLAANAGLLALLIIPATIAMDKKDSGCKW